MQKKTCEEFKKEIFNLYGNEYTIVSDYAGCLNEILVKHTANNCDYVFSTTPQFLISGRSKCPICEKHQKQTDASIREKIRRQYNDEYVLLEPYQAMNKKVKMKHLKCCHPTGEFVWETSLDNFLYKHQLCEYCRKGFYNKYTVENVQRLIDANHLGVTTLSKEISANKQILFKCNQCGLEYNVRARNFMDNACFYTCPKCSPRSTGKKIIPGFNDIKTVNRPVYDLLVDKDNGIKNGLYTSKQFEFKCPRCGSIFKALPQFVFNQYGKIACPYCKDGISYPEKYMNNLLKCLNVEYIYQLTSKHFSWCDSYRYDFYIPKYNIIIETNGNQHYEDGWLPLEETEDNDYKKMKLALLNGIKDYIVIDSRISDGSYIKKSIIESSLSNYYDLSKVDWSKCAIDSCKSLLVTICSEWNQDKSKIADFVEKYNISRTTVERYLKSGTELGICNFNLQEYKTRVRKAASIVTNKKNSCQIYCRELNIVYPSIRYIKKEIGDITKALDKEDQTMFGCHWFKVSSLPNNYLEKQNPDYVIMFK